MISDVDVKVAVYRHIAESGRVPTAAECAERVGAPVADIVAAWERLQSNRLLLLAAGPSGEDAPWIRMAPPFSGVPTQHAVEVRGTEYFANCAWDALGVVAALGGEGVVRSRCERSRVPLELECGPDGPPPSDWLFHCHVPAAHWWDDLVFT